MWLKIQFNLWKPQEPSLIILDRIILMPVADPDHVVHWRQYPTPGLSERDVILCVCNRLIIPQSWSEFISCRNYSEIYYEALFNEAFALPWNECTFRFWCWPHIRKFHFIVSSIYDQHAALDKKRVTKWPALRITDFIFNYKIVVI